MKTHKKLEVGSIHHSLNASEDTAYVLIEKLKGKRKTSQGKWEAQKSPIGKDKGTSKKGKLLLV